MAMPPNGRWEEAPNLLRDRMGYRVSRFHRKRDLGKPIRPVTAYDIFFRNVYPWLKDRRPDLTQQQMFSEIGRMWRETTSWEDRQVCYDYADQEKEKYDKQMKVWRVKRETQKEKDRKALQDGTVVGPLDAGDPDLRPPGRGRGRGAPCQVL